jgi:Phosphodiester glycosidase
MHAFESSALQQPAPGPSVTTLFPRLGDGATTTLHLAAFPLAGLSVRVARLPEPEQLVRWCRRTGVAHAIVGGFFVRPSGAPLGELRIAGEPVEHVPFTAPWGERRACVHAGPDGLVIARRTDLPATPSGDLLQAGPLLVRDGAPAIGPADDEGFAAGAHQFDSDITDGRYPRAALALTDAHLFAVVCDGRHAQDAGMTLSELADVLIALGARSALNLDGGGSASLVCDGRLVNCPREEHGVDLLDGRAVSTALVLSPAG